MKKISVILILFLSFITPIKADEIEEMKESGTYFTTISVEDESGNTVERIIKILVTTRNTIVNTQLNEAIDGVDIRYYDETFFDLNGEMYIKMGRVKAWNLSDGKSIPVFFERIEKTGDLTASVRYRTSSGTALELKAYQVEEGGLNLENTYFKPTQEKHYHLSNVMQILSFVVFIPLGVLVLSYFKADHEIKHVKALLYNKTTSSK